MNKIMTIRQEYINIHMDYKKHYNKLIKKSLNRTLNPNIYYERHHIRPKCLGGSDESSNIVRLLPEEHYVAHQLLHKIYPQNNKLIYAMLAMTVRHNTGQIERLNNKLYGWVKRRISKANSELVSGTIHMSKNGVRIRIQPDDYTAYLNNGWVKGWGEYPMKKGDVYLHKNGVTVRVPPDEVDHYITSGFKKGTGKVGNTKGRITITKNGKNKRVQPHLTPLFLQDGWKVGFFKSKNNSLTSVYKNDEVIKIPTVDLRKYKDLGWKKGAKTGTRTLNNKWINKDGIRKRVAECRLDEFLADGWVRGSGVVNSGVKRRGLRKMNNGLVCKAVKVEDIESLLKSGWVLGRL